MKSPTKFGKKGQALGGLSAAVIAIVVAIIVVSISAQVLGTIKSTQIVDSAEANVTDQGISALGTFADFFPVIVVLVILGIILAFFLTRRGGGV